MAETSTDQLRAPAARSSGADERNLHAPEVLRCQWCSVDLEPGVKVCPSCGSAGIDPSMTISDILEESSPEPEVVEAKPKEELEEWWKDDEEEVYENSAATNDDRTPVIIGLVVTAIICTLIGMFLAPPLIASVFESNLGVTVESTSDLRPLGGILGFLVGAFIGAIGIMVTAPRN